ncbi:hypothetical protein DSM3645_03853 [Blastopirellula marina DSM 3645]|uniref:Uncharacterized protein n=1 Tax=Blastopirellula marina DSM 3645 TaxID=314230 RepID=A3ZV82_9BACT|nr:hypothetical protein DSM3645_03853 [Blastopirellula marina DSM 3645]
MSVRPSPATKSWEAKSSPSPQTRDRTWSW